MILKTEDIIPIIPQNRGNLTAPSRLSKHGGPTTADRHTFNLGGGVWNKTLILQDDVHGKMVCVWKHTRQRQRRNFIFKLARGHLIKLDFKGDLVLIMHTQKRLSCGRGLNLNLCINIKKYIIYNTKVLFKKNTSCLATTTHKKIWAPHF